MPGGKKKCSVCDGKGGWEVESNGSSADSARVSRQWVKCTNPQCEGGYVDND